MGTITHEGRKDFEEITHSLGMSDPGSAYHVLAKYSLKCKEDVVKTISNMTVHPTSLALRRHDRASAIQKTLGEIMSMMMRVVIDFQFVECCRLGLKTGKQTFRKNYYGTKRVVVKISTDLFEWKECKEFKGFVCRNCECQKYHLSHQLQLWDDNAENVGGKQNDPNKLSQHRNRKSKRKKKSCPRPFSSQLYDQGQRPI